MPGDSELTSYDNIADVFLAHIARTESWNNLYERPNTLSKLPELKGKNVLDLGCGSGFYAEYALEHGASVTAIDISQKMINRLVQKINSPSLTIFRADMSQPMPFLTTESFDCVVCSLVIDYIKNWEPLIEEMHRVTKNGGRAVLSTHHPFSTYLYRKPKSYFDFKLIEDTWAVNSRHPFKTHYYIRPLHEVLRPIIQSEFKIISIEEPLPDERCKVISPQTYEQLLERPGFLFIVLEK
jgi:ubiquinone/menaquinone biosynthesis C-methylase UbiE